MSDAESRPSRIRGRGLVPERRGWKNADAVTTLTTLLRFRSVVPHPVFDPLRPLTHLPRRGAFALLLTACLLVGGLLGACGSDAGSSRRTLEEFSGSTMGTYFRVKVVMESGTAMTPERRSEVSDLIEGELERVNRLMSTYLDESEVSRFNEHRSTEPFSVSAETFTVIREAMDLGELTDGALDITVGPLVDAYGFGPDGARPEVSEGDLRRLRARVGLGHLRLDAEAQTVRKDRSGVEIDLSSIAKGRAIDLVAERLADAGYSDYMVEVGGEIRVSGQNVLGKPWRLGIERPQASRGGVQRVIELESGALATSGDYRNFRMIEGERVSHIIDPRTGRPISHWLASVSVVQPTCARADGLATAFMVLGTETAWKLAKDEDIAALFLVRDGDGFVERATPAFERRFPNEGQRPRQDSE